MATSGLARVQQSDFQALLPIDRMHGRETGEDSKQAASAGKDAPDAPVFSDSFEDVLVEPPLQQGMLRLTTKAYATPAPDGTQLETMSAIIYEGSGYRFLQADSGLLGRVFPNPTAFANRVDFDRMTYSPGGLVEASISAVDLSLNDPAASTSGCEASDFNAFPAGHIALIQRGTCSYAQKAGNAEAAGAVGVIIFNQGTSGKTALMLGTLGSSYRGSAPVVSTTFALGQLLAAGGSTTIRMRVSSGQRNNDWELVPVVSPTANAGTYWIRNSETGELLATRPSVPLNSIPISTVVVDSAAADDRRAWWSVSGQGVVRITSVAENKYLVLINYNNSIYVLTTNSNGVSAYCPNNDPCDLWRLDNSPLQTPAESTRLRSGLGEIYLHQDGDVTRVDRVKPGWPSAKWVLEPVPYTPYRRLLNLQTGDYLHVENGALEAGEIEAAWWSAMWELEPATEIGETNVPGSLDTTPLGTPISNPSGYFHLRNRWTNQLINVQGGLAIASDSAPASLRSLWVLDDTPIPPIGDANMRSALTSALGLASSADIRASEAAGLYQFWAGDAGISDIVALQNFPNLTDLRLPGNAISNLSPLANLTELDYLDLSRNPMTSLAALDGNAGLGDGDRVLLLRTGIGQAAPTDGAPLLARRATVIPAPGLMALHDVSTGQLVDPYFGSPDLTAVDVATNSANWSIEYVVAQDRFRIRNQGQFDLNSGYLSWDDQNNNLQFTGSGVSPEWRFEQVGAGQYQIKNTRMAGSTAYLQICYGQLKIGQDNPDCRVAYWYIDPALIQNAISRALANYYDPKFQLPGVGYTRIQHTATREFLTLDSGTFHIGQVQETSLAAQWKLLPVQFDTTAYFVVQNRQYTNQFLYRHADGSLRAGPLPDALPDGSLWATNPANQPFLFALDGTTGFLIRPLQDRQKFLRSNAGQLTFSSASSSSVWRLDGGVGVPAPAQSTGFLQLKQESPPLFDTNFTISWRQPSGPTRTLQMFSYTGSGTFTMSSSAQDIHATAICVGCGPLFSDVTIFDLHYDRPPNRCLETRGPFFDPHYGTCDPTGGSLVAFASNAAQQATCEIAAMVNYLPLALDQLAIEDVSNDLIDGDFEHAQELLFAQGDLRGPDLSACEPYRSMSFGAGASAGVFNFNAGGEIGVVWGLTSEASGAASYTVTGSSVDSSLRLASVDASVTLGVWKDAIDDFKGKAMGFSLQANREIPVDLRKLKELKKVGLSGGITLWFQCDSGSGPVVNTTLCVIREDSRYIGYSFDFSAGVDISLPLPGSIGVTYATTCTPANFSGNDCF